MIRHRCEPWLAGFQVQELTNIKSFAVLVEESNHPVHPKSAQTFASKALTEQLIVSVNFRSRDDRCPLTADRTIRVNMLDADGHAR